MLPEDPKTILVVDDTPGNIEVLGSILTPHFKVKVAMNGKVALKIAAQPEKPDLILLDVMMPDMDGYEVCRQLKADISTANIPIIFVTAKSEIQDEQIGFDLGAVDYLTKPISPPRVMARVKTQLALYDRARHLESIVEQRTQELQIAHIEVIRRLGKAAEFKDNETGMHVIRMSYFAKFLAQQLDLAHDWVELLYQAAPMHDIGKIGIPDAVLLKPGKLDLAEREIMEKHAEYGANIIGNSDVPVLKMAREIAIAHHERWDGSGYPNGLKGEQIPLSARIIAIADVFDALTCERPYKQAWSEERALGLLQEEAGKHFDPTLVPLFFNCLEQIRAVQQQFKDQAAE
ncbi:two-component system response regulator [Thalassotalea euphylliae]|uniref:Two-component system response regulator n=1 Tax=Thalassotalea euphylliae TaxID=1655234 RepID=A0A3E0TM63_9GAMM|nr:two-component system response regulator [Thalassotalea euphylliae]REL25360.1 two-component system response regulator [Thalassotalea euphylliae]